MSWLSSCLLVQSIDNIDNNHRFENHFEIFCYFWKLAGSHRSRCWRRVQSFSHDSQQGRGVVRVARGIGEQGCSGGRCCGGFLSPRGKPVMIKPSWKEARGVAISSPLDILLVGAPGACTSAFFWQSSSPISHQVTLLCSTAHSQAR